MCVCVRPFFAKGLSPFELGDGCGWKDLVGFSFYERTHSSSRSWTSEKDTMCVYMCVVALLFDVFFCRRSFNEIHPTGALATTTEEGRILDHRHRNLVNKHGCMCVSIRGWNEEEIWAQFPFTPAGLSILQRLSSSKSYSKAWSAHE